MRRELVNLLEAYLLGWKTIYDCSEWLASIDWDDPGLDPESLEMAGLLELLATEVAEGLRPEADFWREAAKFVASKTNSVYAPQVNILESVAVNSSGDITAWPPGVTVTEVQGSQSWSISPLPVSS